MSRPTKSIIEQAIADAAEAEYARVTSGLNKAQKAQVVAYALTELQKLRGDRDIPDYEHPAVALFYALWYLPSQMNLACSLIQSVLPFRNEVDIVDFGAGPGALCFGTAMAIAQRSGRKDAPRITVHEVDCATMTQLSAVVWRRFLSIAHSDGNQGCQRAVGRIKKRTYSTADEVVEALGGNTKSATEMALTALHVVYRENVTEVRNALALLWKSTQPSWAFVTTQRVGAKLDVAKEITPFNPGIPTIPELSVHGKCSQLTSLRREIRSEFPPDWSSGGLLVSEVNWDSKDRGSPHVFTYPRLRGSSP